MNSHGRVAGKDWLDKLKDFAQIVSLIVISVTVGLLGWNIQATLKDREIRRDYVQIAAGILSSSVADEKLRGWASQVIQDNSPTPFGVDVKNRLVQGQSQLYITPRVPAPMADAMVAPPSRPMSKDAGDTAARWLKEMESVGGGGTITPEDVLKLIDMSEEAVRRYVEAAEVADKYAISLRYLQQWSDMIVKAQGTLPSGEKDGNRVEK